MEQDWWQKRLRRERPRPQRPVPSLDPSAWSLNAGLFSHDRPLTNPPVNQSDMGEETMQPSMRSVDQGASVGLPMQQPAEMPAEQAPPRISQEALDYNQILSPPKKTNKFLDALYIAGQAAGNIFDTTDDFQPIERLGDAQKRRKDASAMQRIQIRNARQKAEQESAQRQAETDGLIQKPIIARQELERKQQKDDRDYEIKTKTLDWKKEDRDQYYDLEDIKLKAREKHDEETFKRADAKQKELETYHKALIGERGADRTSREKIAGLSEAGRTRRTQLAIAARKTLTEFQEAQRSGRAEQANALRTKLAQIKAEADALQ
jgi:hypothetical protein